MRREVALCLLLLLAATPALAQVQVDARLEKNRYLAGEPVVVLVEVRNVGDEAVGYSTCDGDVRLQVPGANRRVPPNIFGCFSSMVRGGGCGVDHPPLLQPGQTTTFRYLLRDYDLRPGEYQLSASGKAGVRWQYSSVYVPNTPPPRHKETDPVPGAQFDRRLSLAIVPATQHQLRDAFAPLVSDADGTDALRRSQARAAIVESAPPFLESLIARFAAEDQFNTTAIDALGRIASRRSRLQLRHLARNGHEAQRSAAVLALARAGHRDDADFLANILRDETMDQRSRRYAAPGLGHIGGNASVRYLQRAIDTVPPEIRPSIATALGNTRSRLAVPVLIGMFGNNPSRNEVCGALQTLTHRYWCDGTADDPAATRRQWLRSWNESGSKTAIFGPADCPGDRMATAVAAPNSVIAAPPIRLLPTDREAARVRVLEDALDKHLTDNVQASYDQLKTIVQDFVIRQLDAAPAISDTMLREQLQKVIGRTWAAPPDSGLYVSSATSWGPRATQRLWAVAYVVSLGSHGPGGTGVVIDSYVWEPGRTRLAGRQDSDYSGYSLNVDWLSSGPDKVSLLAYGGMSGSNGLGNWKASVYSCDKAGVHRVWQESDLHGLTAVGRAQLITVRHARPCQGAASSACGWTYKVYSFKPGTALPGTVTLVSRETRDY